MRCGSPPALMCRLAGRKRLFAQQGERRRITMLKKGLCVAGLRRDLEPRAAFEQARAAGFDGIELGINAEGRVGLPPPYDAPDRAAELARSVGLELPSVGGPGFLDLFPREPDEVLPEIVARVERGCQAARVL